MHLVPLNPKLFAPDVDKQPTRKGFGEGLLDAAEKDHRVVALSADLTESTQAHLFAKKFPERFVQVGIAEQNLISVASGLAAMGKIPFATSYAMFSPGRNWQQIRSTICYNHANVKIIGSHAGLTVGPDGGSHQALEDIAITRVLPRMTIICPCDAVEAKKATLAIAGYEGPVYMRLCREPLPTITDISTPFEIGKASWMFLAPHPVVGIISTGPLTYFALLAAKKLHEEGIPVAVVHIATIKPIDEEAIVKLASIVRGIVTVEEHQVTGGLGGAVAEVLAKHHPTPMRFVGVQDDFGQSGEPRELLSKYKLDETGVISAVKELLPKNTQS
jgi:transketolase